MEIWVNIWGENMRGFSQEIQARHCEKPLGDDSPWFMRIMGILNGITDTGNNVMVFAHVVYQTTKQPPSYGNLIRDNVISDQASNFGASHC